MEELDRTLLVSEGGEWTRNMVDAFGRLEDLFRV